MLTTQSANHEYCTIYGFLFCRVLSSGQRKELLLLGVSFAHHTITLRRITYINLILVFFDYFCGTEVNKNEVKQYHTEFELWLLKSIIRNKNSYDFIRS